ncbi:Uncharacterised protein [uncultured archaeon]|nr:Uncharacterised protein [uncultured archaeon]
MNLIQLLKKNGDIYKIVYLICLMADIKFQNPMKVLKSY